MRSRSGRYVLVFNGEIYNYKELKDDLLARGHRFVTESDTETLVHLYEQEGVEGLARLRGMFSYGKMELALETFDVSRMIDGVVASVQPLVDRNQNVLRIERAPDVGRLHADATKVRQILVNLLSNAAKFTEHGTIMLRARRAERPLADDEAGESVIVFEVADTGIGIAADQFERIFDAFAQAKTPSAHKIQGTGLGLAISRHYSRMMGGDLTVASQPGAGSIFTVTLPTSVVNHGARPFYAEL